MTDFERLPGDDVLLLALAKGSTVRSAAEQAGVSEATAFRRLRVSGFVTELNRVRIARKIMAGPTYTANEKEILTRLLACRPNDRPDPKAVADITRQLHLENADRKSTRLNSSH